MWLVSLLGWLSFFLEIAVPGFNFGLEWSTQIVNSKGIRPKSMRNISKTMGSMGPRMIYNDSSFHIISSYSSLSPPKKKTRHLDRRWRHRWCPHERPEVDSFLAHYSGWFRSQWAWLKDFSWNIDWIAWKIMEFSLQLPKQRAGEWSNLTGKTAVIIAEKSQILTLGWPWEKRYQL